MTKVYYARVLGDFRVACRGEVEEEKKDEEQKEEKNLSVTCNLSVYCTSNVEATWDCSKPDEVPFEFKPRAKHALTLFEFIRFDEASNHSIIRC